MRAGVPVRAPAWRGGRTPTGPGGPEAPAVASAYPNGASRLPADEITVYKAVGLAVLDTAAAAAAYRGATELGLGTRVRLI